MLSSRSCARGGVVQRVATTFAESLPYQAIVESLRTALPLLAALELKPIWLAVVVPLLGELKIRRPDLPAVSALDPDRERARLVEGLARCIEELARPRPLLLILEDLHWAGAETVAFVEFLARRAGSHHMLILLTYREEEATRTHPLRNVLRRLRGERMVGLGRLSPPAVEALVEQMPALGALKGGLADHLYARSEGHPPVLAAALAAAYITAAH
jgi:predicted ATPase